jgi:hypothetical protein
MRLFRLLSMAVLVGFAAFAFSASGPARAAPVAASSLAAQVAAPSLTEKTRLYCYNRYTGQFLHWGPCGGYRRHYYRPYYYHPHYYHPHYYHRNYYHRRYYY